MKDKKIYITCHPSLKKTMEKATKDKNVEITTNTKLKPETWYATLDRGLNG